MSYILLSTNCNIVRVWVWKKKQSNVEVERCMCGLCTPNPARTCHASLQKLLPSNCRLATVAANEQTPRRMLLTLLLLPLLVLMLAWCRKKKDIVELAGKKAGKDRGKEGYKEVEA